MRFIRTAKVGADPFSQLASGQQAVLLGDIALGMEGNITVLVTTFADMKRVTALRDWTWREVNTDLTLAGRFRFALLPKRPEPSQVLLDKRWYNLADSQPVALLEE